MNTHDDQRVQGVRESNAFKLYANHIGENPDDVELRDFEGHYLGGWKGTREWAEDYAESLGWYAVMESAGINPRYFDLEAFIKDCEVSGEVYFITDPDAHMVHVFWGY